MESFVTLVNGSKPSIIVGKLSILDVSVGPGCTFSKNYKRNCCYVLAVFITSRIALKWSDVETKPKQEKTAALESF